jgi:hypothetical protein
MVRGRAVLQTWPVDGDGPPDVGVVDRLARVQLMARRFGCSIRLWDASEDLWLLLDLLGLSHLFGGSRSAVEMGRQPEGRKQLRVDEVVVPDDPVA